MLSTGSPELPEPTWRVVVASHNPVKLQAVQAGFSRMFPLVKLALQPVAAASGVAEQPFSDQDTLYGACQRAQNARKLAPDAGYWVGIEGGVQDCEGQLAAFAWVVVLSDTLTGKGRTGTFFLPEVVAQLVRQGKELGEADDIVFQRANSKQEEGAIGLLTGNATNRTMLYEEAVVLALVPFKNPHLYGKERS